MESITLQVGDSIVTSGDSVGQVQFAASAESDGGASRYVIGQIYAQAEGAFGASSNPASIVISTSAADNLPASGKLKITHEGHVLPMEDNLYDLGSPDFRFRNLYVSSGVTSPTGYFDVISFNTSYEDALTQGQISWDSTEGTVNIGLTDTTTIHVGEHRFYRVRNTTGGTLYKGQIVYAQGVHPNGLITPALYVANDTILESRFIGAILEDINNNSNGYVIDFGRLEGLDLDGSATNYSVGDETWSQGDILYAHPTASGKLTNVEPKHAIKLGISATLSKNVRIISCGLGRVDLK